MGGPWFSLRGVHELCIQRENDSIQFKRWSRSENCSKLWATLRFQTWEGTSFALFQTPSAVHSYDIRCSNDYLDIVTYMYSCRADSHVLYILGSQVSQLLDSSDGDQRIRPQGRTKTLSSVSYLP